MIKVLFQVWNEVGILQDLCEQVTEVVEQFSSLKSMKAGFDRFISVALAIN